MPSDGKLERGQRRCSVSHPKVDVGPGAVAWNAVGETFQLTEHGSREGCRAHRTCLTEQSEEERIGWRERETPLQICNCRFRFLIEQLNSSPEEVRGASDSSSRNAASIALTAAIASATPKSVIIAASPLIRILSGLMSRCTIPRNIEENSDCIPSWKLALARESVTKRTSVDPWHDQEGGGVHRPDRDNRHDVSML